MDRTDPNAAQQGREEAEQEYQERMRILQSELERGREQAIREAEERARCDDDEERERLERQRLRREEEERKLKEEISFHQLKDALMNYDLQECPRIKKESFRDLDIGDMDGVRIALIGPTGSGKTSFIGKSFPVLLKTKSTNHKKMDNYSLTYLSNHFEIKAFRLVKRRVWNRRKYGIKRRNRYVTLPWYQKFLDDYKPKIHLKREFHCFKLHRSFSVSFNLSKFGEIFLGGI